MFKRYPLISSQGSELEIGVDEWSLLHRCRLRMFRLENRGGEESEATESEATESSDSVESVERA